VTFVPRIPPEDSALPVLWPYALSDGWSVEWDPSPANKVPLSDVELGLSSISVLRRLVASCFMFFAAETLL
jgi:hypothetical protein